jgi:sec-independent protein translocase protein TatA
MFEGLFQPTHLILILIVSVLVFGPNKLPQIGAGLGKSIRDFKKAMAEGSDDAPAQARQLPAPPEEATITASAPTEVRKA